MKNYLLLTVPLLALAAPVQAQTSERIGLRVEGMIFYEDADLGDIDDGQPTGRADEDVDASFGGGIGYDFIRTGTVDVGADLEISQSTTNRSVFVPAFTTPVASLNIGSEIYLGGRVTGTISGPVRAHIKAGLSSLTVSTTITRPGFTEANFPDGDFFIDDRMTGYRVGAGLSYSDDEQPTYYGVEYRYSAYKQDLKRNQFGVFIGARF